MPVVSYRVSEEAVMREIHEVAGLKKSANQVLSLSQGATFPNQQ